MRIGGQMFFTDYSMTPAELAPALEERGFESLWVPEHSHIPLVRTKPFPGGTELPRPYYDIMDPFLVLTAAAVGLVNGLLIAYLNMQPFVVTLGMLSVVLPISYAGFGVGHVAFDQLFALCGMTGGATVLNNYLIGQTVPCLVGVVPYLALRREAAPMA